MSDDRKRWLVEPGKRFRVDDVDTRSTAGAPGDKDETQATFPALWDELRDLQERLYAEDRRSLLLVLQGMDTSGKGGTVEHVFHGSNPIGTEVSAFKAPTSQELAHDFLWRIHARVPGHGRIGVFDRSHYEDVLIVRVKSLVPEAVWKPRYDHINAFESNLVAGGTTVVKCFLHISRDEQAERLRARLDEPAKRWKFRRGDLDERARWDDYMEAYEAALTKTSTEDAPWYAIPADRKWYRNWAILRILVETLRDMDPRFPEPEEDLSGIVID